MDKEFSDPLLAEDFQLSLIKTKASYFKQIDSLHLMEIGINDNQTHYEVTISRKDDGIVALAMTPISKLKKMLSDYGEEIALRTKQLTRKKPGRKPKA